MNIFCGQVIYVLFLFCALYLYSTDIDSRKSKKLWNSTNFFFQFIALELEEKFAIRALLIKKKKE